MSFRPFRVLSDRWSLSKLLRTSVRNTVLMAIAATVLTLGVAACSTGSVTSQNVAGDVASAPADGASGEAAPAGAPMALGSTLDQILSSGQVRIAVPQDSQPFGSMGADGQPQGYDVDVAKLIAEALEVELELIPVTSQNRIPYLQTNRADLVISSLGATPERAKSIYFSLPYAPFYSGIYSSEGTEISSYDDLGGKTVGVTQGALEDLELSNNAPDTITIQRFEDNSTTASALLAGQVEAIATGNTIAAQVIKDNPDRGIENKFVMRNSPCFIGLRRGDLDLLQWVNVFVMNKRLSGELDELSETWFGEPLELPSF